jgi:tetratricopeptide (TPR) repeat protein
VKPRFSDLGGFADSKNLPGIVKGKIAIPVVLQSRSCFACRYPDHLGAIPDGQAARRVVILKHRTGGPAHVMQQAVGSRRRFDCPRRSGTATFGVATVRNSPFCMYNLLVMKPSRAVLAAGVVLLGASLCLPQSGVDQQNEFAQHIQKAQSYVRQKRPDLAIPELQAAAAIDPENVTAQANLGVLLYFQDKAAEAIPHLRVAVQKQPASAMIQGLLGIAELNTKDVDEGRKDLATAFPLIDDPTFKLQVGLDLVTLYAQSEDLDLAAGVLSQLRKSYPKNPEVLYAAYRTYSDLSTEARVALSLAAPDSAQMHQLLAHEEIREGDTNGAIAQFRKAIAIDPRLPDVHYELAEVLKAARDPAIKKEAFAEYGIALQQNPRDEKSILSLAELAEEQGEPEQAFRDYSKASELEPSDAVAKVGLAKILIARNEGDKALPLLEDAVRIDPTIPTAHYLLGTLYRKMGRADDARRQVELYKQYEDTKDKLRLLYKDLLVQPKEISADDQDDK